MEMVILGVFGPWQAALVLLAVLLLFGGRKIPELMRGIGGGIREFKKSTKEDSLLDEKDKGDK
ncbi:twin-arginine translocase TatA/TatE family subunit [Ichthyobacterium seriolicida]|uniref:Sec-independent protein translocase protein TatA n=1 Tax=Ichthyobacterium seriolicida TaxID=242600 RepID=A0A1J1DZH0_9FLAO|nr:twin-arginine translocase TatA/TatE family subunit [Ichthyobacterium seriolicida]BAV95314.1 twin-arginine translocation protein TatA [Ichthyobacterium seriolicida]